MKKSRAVIALILVAVITGLMAYTALVAAGTEDLITTSSLDSTLRAAPASLMRR